MKFLQEETKFKITNTRETKWKDVFLLLCDQHKYDQTANYEYWIDKQPIADSEYEEVCILEMDRWVDELKCCKLIKRNI
tara:strand:+ start:311 stop:547 length:237 start_codon:yes stop_codon:yes gene_type:complete